MNIIKRSILVAIAVFLGISASMAQRIAVVAENGETIICRDLQEAIEGASPGSVIYLSSGSFNISDDVKITKKLCITGIGHKAKSDNADGRTAIVGNLWFNENSSGSSVMGCYISGNVNIGNDGSSVNDVVVKCCNVNSIQVKNNNCDGTVVNQNYIRSKSVLKRGTLFINNIATYVTSECGKIYNNIFKNGSTFTTCYVARNIFISGQSTGNNSTFFANMAKSDVGDYPINIGDLEWADLFVKYNNGTISPTSDFHFAENYASQYKDCGIYGGSGFNDSGQPPLPFVQAKSIPEQTDATGNLSIKVRVNTGE